MRIRKMCTSRLSLGKGKLDRKVITLCAVVRSTNSVVRSLFNGTFGRYAVAINNVFQSSFNDPVSSNTLSLSRPKCILKCSHIKPLWTLCVTFLSFVSSRDASCIIIDHFTNLFLLGLMI